MGDDQVDKFLEQRRKHRQMILDRYKVMDSKPDTLKPALAREDDKKPAKQKRSPPVDSNPICEFDMFSDNPIGIPHLLSKQTSKRAVDNFDDEQGYYRVVIGEMILNRFEIISTLGKGVFSNVVKANDLKFNKMVAVKITRSNELMRNAAKKELEILKLLDSKNTITLMMDFVHKGHTCMVFELMHMDLRHVLKKFGKGIGLNLKGVKSYATQLFNALNALKQIKVLHCDIKPDNILVTESMAMLKLADFGSAMYINEIDVTPYLISRFYRAPEIILGCLPFDYAVDVWSVGCTLYELYTGKILLPGRSNNHMLKLMMELCGKFPRHVLRKGTLSNSHFNENLDFISQEVDKINGKTCTKVLESIEVRPLKDRLVLSDDEALFTDFIHFLGRCLMLAPEKRMTPQESFLHPFLTRQY